MLFVITHIKKWKFRGDKWEQKMFRFEYISKAFVKDLHKLYKKAKAGGGKEKVKKSCE